MRLKAVATCAAVCAASVLFPAVSRAVQMWTVHSGETVVKFDQALLRELGLEIQPGPSAPSSDGSGLLILDVSADEVPLVVDTAEGGRAVGFLEGALHHRSGLLIMNHSGEQIFANDLVVPVTSNTVGDENFKFIGSDIMFDLPARIVTIQNGSIAISEKLAELLRNPDLAGRVIGEFAATANLVWDGGEPLDIAPVERTACGGSTGPDVIVGGIEASGAHIANYDAVGTIDAFAVATTSCNMGTSNLQWVSSTNRHPVIPQNMYRLKTVSGATRIEQIGQSWMKHAFTALTQNLCCTCNGSGGSVLGVGCSDPYTATRNGSQLTTTGGLGPRFDVNPHRGIFTMPYPFRNDNGTVPNTTINRRLQVQFDDLNPALNSGASYFVEAQYVTPDDAENRNQNNNASYRACTIAAGTPTQGYNATASGSTFKEEPAIKAWKKADATVVETNVSIPEENVPAGNNSALVIMAADATDLGGGTWHYEYAIYNMNSDRAISSFSLPVGNGLTVTNIGFRDVPYHSGDGFGSTPAAPINFDGTDWPGSYSGGSVSWALIPATPVQNSNALRWGTMYNFRFDCNAPPTTGNATLGLFKALAGNPDSVVASTVLPNLPCIAPVINTPAPAAAICGTSFNSAAITATGTPPFTWSLQGTPPGGMTIDSGGVISWPSPVAAPAAYNVTVRATSQCNPSNFDEDTFVLTVKLGDFSGDGLADANDIDLFVQAMLLGGNPCAGDMNGDLVVNGDDVQLFVNGL